MDARFSASGSARWAPPLQSRHTPSSIRQHDLQHGRHQFGLRCQQQAQRDGQGQHPLAHWPVGNDLVHQLRCAMRRTPHDGQKPRRLQLKATSLWWPQSPQRRRRKPWARMPHSRKASNSSLGVLRQVGSSGGFGLLEERRRVLLHQAVQRGLLGAVAVVVDRGAIGRPAGLLRRGLHALLISRLWCFTVSDRALRRHGHCWRLLPGAHLRVSTPCWNFSRSCGLSPRRCRSQRQQGMVKCPTDAYHQCSPAMSRAPKKGP